MKRGNLSQAIGRPTGGIPGIEWEVFHDVEKARGSWGGRGACNRVFCGFPPYRQCQIIQTGRSKSSSLCPQLAYRVGLQGRTARSHRMLGGKRRGWVVVLTGGGGRRLLSARGGGGVGIALQWRPEWWAGKVWWVCSISSAGWVAAARVRPVKRAVELNT